jgi:hypothetical protein
MLKYLLQNVKLIHNCFSIDVRPQFYKYFLHVTVQCGLKINNYSDFTRKVCCWCDVDSSICFALC